MPTVLIIDREAREIMYLVASVCPSVRLSVNALTAEPFDYYQSKIFVCVCKCGACAANFADAVDRLLILLKTFGLISLGFYHLGDDHYCITLNFRESKF